MPPLVDRRDDLLETKMPPRKRLCLSTLGSMYEVGESSTARPTGGRGIDYGFVSTLDAEARRREIAEVGYDIRDTWIDPTETVPEIAPMTASSTDGRDSLTDGRHEARDGRYTSRVVSTARIMAPMTRQGPSTFPNNTNPNNMTPESVQAMIDQALLRNSTNGVGSHSSHEDNRRNVQTARLCFYADFIKCQPLNFKGTEGVVKFATCTLLDAALTWWNNQIRSLGPDAYSMTWETPKRQNVARVYNMRIGERKPYSGNLPKSSGNANVTNTQRNNGANPKGNGCFECKATWHFKSDCLKLKNKDGEKVNAPGWVYAVGNAKKRGNASRDPDSNVVTGTFLLNNRYASILFDTSADRSFISTSFSSLIDIVPTPLRNSYDVELADGKIVRADTIMQGCTLNFLGHPFNIDLMPVELGSFAVIIGMDWLRRCHVVIVCDEKLVQIPYGNETLTFRGNESNNGRESRLIVISCSKA
nr:putative reverse transcriptase domain-containing protein [Tanacetum cinerariifolium]